MIAVSRIRRTVIASVVVWAIAVLGYAAVLVVESSLGDLGCEDPVGSSNYGHAVWQWWLPGTTCEYSPLRLPGYGWVPAHVDRPSLASGAVLIALVAWPVATWLLARWAQRRAHHADRHSKAAVT